MYFLTEIDPNAKTKGSRDPLGTLGVWSGFARRVVGNLTTQTTSLDDFRVLVIGSWLEDQLAGKVEFPGDAFLVWEQLTAYARLEVLDDPPGFRGITKAKKLVGQGGVRVSPERSDQLLANQRGYGIWGLYRASAWRSGLTCPDDQLTRGSTLELVEEVYLPILTQAWGPGAQELKSWARNGHDLRLPRDRAKLEAIAACIEGPLRPAEAELYRDTIVFGGERGTVGKVQTELARQLQKRVTRGERPTRDDVLHIAAVTGVPELALALEDIVACESVLSPAVMCFSYLSRQDRTPVDEIAERLATHFEDAPMLIERRWLDRLRTVATERRQLIRAVGDASGTTEGRWIAIAEALHAKTFSRLVHLLVEQNTAVSRDRGAGSGWVAIDAHGVLQVTMADTSTDLVDPDDVTSLWWNSYLMGNLSEFVHRLPELTA